MTINFNVFNWGQPIVQAGGQASREFIRFMNNIFNANGAGQTLGSAAFINTGTSGDTVPLLNTANEWAQIQTLDKPLVFNGSTSGSTELEANANAGGVVTLPTVTTTLVGQNTTDTLTNKTLTSPALGGTVTGNNTIPLPILAQIAGRAVLGNPTVTTGSVQAIAVGQLPATATNDSATAGNLGEFLSATVTSGAAVTLTNATVTNVASVSLTAGNWLVTGNVAYNITGTAVNNIQAWTSTTSASVPTTPGSGAYISLVTGSNWGNGTVIPAGVNRLTLTTPTTVYLSTFAGFASGTATAFGVIEAWRPR